MDGLLWSDTTQIMTHPVYIRIRMTILLIGLEVFQNLVRPSIIQTERRNLNDLEVFGK